MRSLPWKIVERSYAGDGGRESRWNGWVARVGPVLLRINRVTVNRGMKRGLDLRGVAGELDHVAAVRDFVDLKAVRLEPPGNFLDVRLRRTKLFAEFLGRQPFVIIGRRAVLLLREQSLERRALSRSGLEHEHHAVHREAARRRALIVFRAGERMGIASKDDELAVVNRLSDQGRRAGGLSGAALRGNADGKDRWKTTAQKKWVDTPTPPRDIEPRDITLYCIRRLHAPMRRRHLIQRQPAQIGTQMLCANTDASAYAACKDFGCGPRRIR